MENVRRLALVVLVGFVMVPTMAYAQGEITGVVRDTSGAVLPGVTVEAASPVLIEKVRSVVSDGSGQYRIVDLRPGPYTVTFSVPSVLAQNVFDNLRIFHLEQDPYDPDAYIWAHSAPS